ncbi:MAG: glycoside hydrolase family 2 TIM barrel-domain containing protein [Caldilineaceae bacterium]
MVERDKNHACIIGPMYPPVARIIELAQKPDNRPIMICEYAHSMGSSTGNLKEDWDAVDQYPRLQQLHFLAQGPFAQFIRSRAKELLAQAAALPPTN